MTPEINHRHWWDNVSSAIRQHCPSLVAAKIHNALGHAGGVFGAPNSDGDWVFDKYNFSGLKYWCHSLIRTMFIDIADALTTSSADDRIDHQHHQLTRSPHDDTEHPCPPHTPGLVPGDGDMVEC